VLLNQLYLSLIKPVIQGQRTVRLIDGHTNSEDLPLPTPMNRKCLVRISGGTLTTLTEDFCGFSVALEKHSEKVLD
jgi:hypothetical protein